MRESPSEYAGGLEVAPQKIPREYLAVATSLGLQRSEVAALEANGVRSSFLPDARKAELLAEIASVS